jgi:hypothetical protein
VRSYVMIRCFFMVDNRTARVDLLVQPIMEAVATRSWARPSRRACNQPQGLSSREFVPAFHVLLRRLVVVSGMIVACARSRPMAVRRMVFLSYSISQCFFILLKVTAKVVGLTTTMERITLRGTCESFVFISIIKTESRMR